MTRQYSGYDQTVQWIWPDSKVDMTRQYSGYGQTVQWIWPDNTVDMARQYSGYDQTVQWIASSSVYRHNYDLSMFAVTSINS